MAMFVDDTALTAAGLQLVSYTILEVDCPLKERLMSNGGFCKNAFSVIISCFQGEIFFNSHNIFCIIFE